jgi:hypothetical protein
VGWRIDRINACNRENEFRVREFSDIERSERREWRDDYGWKYHECGFGERSV